MIMTHEEMTDMMASGIALAEKREALCKQGACCPNCGDVQVQLLDTDFQQWKCRKCHFKFNTLIML